MRARWAAPARGQHFLFPAHAPSRVSRGKFVQALRQAENAGALAHDPQPGAPQRRVREAALRRHDWVVYAKTRLARPPQVVGYLRSYTHRTAIGPERLVGIASRATAPLRTAYPPGKIPTSYSYS